MLSQLQEQIDMLGMTNKEQFEYNMLKQAGVSATSDFRQQIAGPADQLYDLQEQTRYLDDVRDALADTFVDFISGAKSAKEAFGDFADYLFKRSLNRCSPTRRWRTCSGLRKQRIRVHGWGRRGSL